MQDCVRLRNALKCIEMHFGGFVVIARNYTEAYRYIIYLPDRHCVKSFVMPEWLGPVRGVAQHEQAI